MAAALKIGLTGGIASGKSSVSDAFVALGAPVIDADAIARELVEPGEPLQVAVVKEFGAGLLDADGRLDRRALRQLIFKDPGRRARLNALLHPAIWERLEARAAAATHPYVVLEVPLLLETGAADRVDRVLVIDCPEEEQLRRLMRRDKETEAGARAILAAQASRATRLAAADDVLDNCGAREELRAKVAALDRQYRALAAARP
jgi:dephospho-CoA kinase